MEDLEFLDNLWKTEAARGENEKIVSLEAKLQQAATDYMVALDELRDWSRKHIPKEQ
ncbi:hypothetical protein [Streptomyces sp. NPDC048720]|uniref:hypothetical protein n=1 Tax=Streptomyces sp. NPDC048720 TaxID=3365588 RepID=UPI003721CFA2